MPTVRQFTLCQCILICFFIIPGYGMNDRIKFKFMFLLYSVVASFKSFEELKYKKVPSGQVVKARD